MAGRGKKTNKRNLVKNPQFTRNRGSSSESDHDDQQPGGAAGGDDIHRDEVLELHDQLEQGELLDDSDSDQQDARDVRNVRVQGRNNPLQNAPNRELLDLIASLQATQTEMAERMKEMNGQLEREVAPYVWKKEGLRRQYAIAEATVAKITRAIAAMDLNHHDRARTGMVAALEVQKGRMKELKIADTSESGWESVNAYKANPIAEDSDDDKRLQRAEPVAKDRVAAKAKKSGFGGRGWFFRRPYWNNHDYNREDSDREYPYRGNGSMKSQDNHQKNGYTPGNKRQQNSNLCFYCGQTGHWQNDCPNKPDAKKED